MAKKAVSENSLIVLNYLIENKDVRMTAQDIADALDMQKKQVDGIVTSGLQRKGLAERIPATVEVEDEEGNTVSKPVKFIQATEAGLVYDHDAALAEDAAAATQKDAE